MKVMEVISRDLQFFSAGLTWRFRAVLGFRGVPVRDRKTHLPFASVSIEGEYDKILRCYRDVLGIRSFRAGKTPAFSSFRTKHEKGPILDLKQESFADGLGANALLPSDVGAIWAHLRDKGFSSGESAGRFLGTAIPSQA